MKKLNSSLGIFIALTFAACSSNKTNYESESADSTSTETTTDIQAPVTDLQGSAAKLAKTASIDFRVKDVYKSSRNISASVRSLGGLISHNHIETTHLNSKDIPLSNDSIQVVSSYNVEAEMTVRVPSARLEDFVLLVGNDATFIKQIQLDVDDKSIDYLSSALKQQSRQKILDAQSVQEKLKTKDALTIANEQDQVIEQKMNNLRTDASVKYSTIELRYTQNTLIKKEVVANNDLSTYEAPVHKRFGEALFSGLMYFTDLIIGLTHFWAFILLGLIGWWIYRVYSKKWKLKASPVE